MSDDTEKQAQPHDPWTSPTSKSQSASSQPGIETSPDWERKLLNQLVLASVTEQRRARRWSVFFKCLLFIYLFGIFLLYSLGSSKSLSLGEGDHTAVIEINGVIAAKSATNADTIVGGMRAAFKHKDTKGVILRINSPGGSPVQAGYINDEIVRLRKKYPAIPLYAVVTDLCASAAYYIAAAADQIYADKASLVGSIGVLIDSYGFVEAMEKLGVERRLLTAGESKGFLDPFSPVKDQDKVHMQKLIDEVHQQFINVVKQGRGDRLSDDPALFSGLVWTGEQGVAIGLVDKLGSSSFVAREVIGAEKLIDFTPKENFIDRFAERIGASVAAVFIELTATSLGSLNLK